MASPENSPAKTAGKHFIEKLKKQPVRIRKLVVFGALFVLAIPFLVLIGLSLKTRLEKYSREQELLRGLQFPQNNVLSEELPSGTGPLWDNFQRIVEPDYQTSAVATSVSTGAEQ